MVQVNLGGSRNQTDMNMSEGFVSGDECGQGVGMRRSVMCNAYICNFVKAVTAKILFLKNGGGLVI